MNRLSNRVKALEGPTVGYHPLPADCIFISPLTAINCEPGEVMGAYLTVPGHLESVSRADDETEPGFKERVGQWLVELRASQADSGV